MTTVLHVGFDGLEVAWQGALPQSAIDELEALRDQAQATSGAVLGTVGTLAAHVGETGARGGYRYRLDTGDDGETWFVKASADPAGWNIRVSVKSLPLALYGLAAVKERIYERLESMGATVLAESIGRVDICADFRMPDGFALHPEAFITHSHTGRATHTEPDDDPVLIHHTGRRVSSVTVGKMPGRQIIVYDKRREAVEKRKFHWFDIWGVPDWREDKRPVWRVEFRAGKRFLKDRWNITTWLDLEEALSDVVADSFRAIRYSDPADVNPNPTRRRTDPMWTAAAGAMAGVLDAGGFLAPMAPAPAAPPGRVVVGRRPMIQETYRALISGLAASYAVAFDMPETAIPDLHNRVAHDIAAHIRNSPEKFRRSMDRAHKRLFFVRNEYAQSDGQAGTDPGDDAGYRSRENRGGPAGAHIPENGGGRGHVDRGPGAAH